MNAGLGWAGIVRLGLVQTALGAVVVLTTSTMNRVMVVELSLAATLPGALIALHYALQVLRPRLGHGSDVGGRRTPWIIGGMFALAIGGTLSAVATMVMNTQMAAGIALAVLAFSLIGLGVGAAGTSLLVLLATHVAPERKATAATIVWTMMIAGFVVTTITAGHFLDPFSFERLVGVTGATAALAVVLAVVAVSGIEQRGGRYAATVPASASGPAFRAALAEIWREPTTRRFTVFVFVSMLAYSAQDLILEPFAGIVFGYTPGQSTRLAGVQHAGVLLGMLLVAVVGSTATGRHHVPLQRWTIVGCAGSALALASLVTAAVNAPGWPLRANVFALGLANGIYAVAAIGSMMSLASRGRERREGVRMGLWGAAQAIAFGSGGALGTIAVDLTHYVTGTPALAYALVFGLEGALFVIAAHLATRLGRRDYDPHGRALLETASVHAIGATRQ